MFSEPRPLLGYLACPVQGQRENCRSNPITGQRTVDTIRFTVPQSDKLWRAIAHFQTLGYERWSETTCSATMSLPRLQVTSANEQTPVAAVQHLLPCLRIVCHCNHPLPARAAAAVLALEELPEELRAEATNLIHAAVDDTNYDLALLITEISNLHLSISTHV